MPEIWMNYGITDVVLDIRAENLEQNIDSEGKILEDSTIQEKLGTLVISDTFVIINRMEGASQALEAEGVKMHNLTDILEITKILHDQNLISDSVLEKLKNQIS